MPAHCADQQLIGADFHQELHQDQLKASHLVYQAATVLAILLFLISF